MVKPLRIGFARRGLKNSRFGKKGQMKIQQMAFMLLAVTLFFALVGMFLLTVVFSDLEQSAETLQERNSLLLVSKLADSPEFSCGSSFGETKSNCIDSDKAMALKSSSESYSDFWGVSGIEITKIYPQEEGSCTESNYPDCGKIVVVDKGSRGIGVSNFVALCRNENNEGIIREKCELARVVVYYGGEDEN